jgi:hypothetical protein
VRFSRASLRNLAKKAEKKREIFQGSGRADDNNINERAKIKKFAVYTCQKFYYCMPNR